MNSKATRARQPDGTAAAAAAPSSFCWQAARVDGAVRSDGDNSRSPRHDGSGGNGCGERCGRGGGGARDAATLPAQREYQSTPILARGQSHAKHALPARLPRRRGNEESGSTGTCVSVSVSGHGRGEFEADSSGSSPRTDPGLITEDFNFCGNSTESSGEMAPLLQVWDNTACNAGAAASGAGAGAGAGGAPAAAADGFHDQLQHQHQHQHPQPGTGTLHPVRRRQRVDVRVGAGAGGGAGQHEAAGHKHRRVPQTQPQDQQQHMPMLTSPPQKRSAATKRGAVLRRIFCGEIDQAAAASSRPGALDHDTRSSAACSSAIPRSRFYATGDKSRSMSSINAAAGSEPPGRMMEIVPVVEGQGQGVDLGGLGQVHDVLCRGGHVKTIQRIRSTGGVSSICSSTSTTTSTTNHDGNNSSTSSSTSSSSNLSGARPTKTKIKGTATQSPGDGGGCAMSSPMSSVNAAMVVVAVTGAEEGDAKVEEVDGVIDVPEEIVGGDWKPTATCSRGGSRALMPLDEKKVSSPAPSPSNDRPAGASSSSTHSGHHEGWEVSRAMVQQDSRSHGSSLGGSVGSIDDIDEVSYGDLSGLSLDLGNLQHEHEQVFGVAPSYDLSESGTLTMHGFVLKVDGIKSTPTPSHNGECECECEC